MNAQKIMWRINSWMFRDQPLISPVPIVKETKHFVTIFDDYYKRDRRVGKEGEFFATFAEAKEYLVTKRKNKAEYLQTELDIALRLLANATAIQEPQS